MGAVAELVFAYIVLLVELTDEVGWVVGHHPIPIRSLIELSSQIGVIAVGEGVEVEGASHVQVRRINVDKRCRCR